MLPDTMTAEDVALLTAAFGAVTAAGAAWLTVFLTSRAELRNRQLRRAAIASGLLFELDKLADGLARMAEDEQMARRPFQPHTPVHDQFVAVADLFDPAHVGLVLQMQRHIVDTRTIFNPRRADTSVRNAERERVAKVLLSVFPADEAAARAALMKAGAAPVPKAAPRLPQGAARLASG